MSDRAEEATVEGLHGEAEVHYSREESAVHFRIKAIKAHELRDVMTGLWLLLDDENRVDAIRELTHYLHAPVSELPVISRAISEGYRFKGKGWSLN